MGTLELAGLELHGGGANIGICDKLNNFLQPAVSRCLGGINSSSFHGTFAASAFLPQELVLACQWWPASFGQWEWTVIVPIPEGFHTSHLDPCLLFSVMPNRQTHPVSPLPLRIP